MAGFKPSFPYSTPCELLIPEYTMIKGVKTKIYPEAGERFNCSWKSYGGTEKTVNGLYAVEDTVVIETWYRPDFRSDCRVKNLQSGDIYEIKNKPENINMRNQFLKFKATAVEGGA